MNQGRALSKVALSFYHYFDSHYLKENLEELLLGRKKYL